MHSEEYEGVKAAASRCGSCSCTRLGERRTGEVRMGEPIGEAHREAPGGNGEQRRRRREGLPRVRRLRNGPLDDR